MGGVIGVGAAATIYHNQTLFNFALLVGLGIIEGLVYRVLKNQEPD